MIPKIRVFAKAGTKCVYGGGYDRDQMFYEVRDIDYYDEEVTVWGCHRKNCGMCDDTYKVDDVVIMQYTGLLDENGNELYEGDIVLDNHTEDVAKIIFDEGKFMCVGDTWIEDLWPMHDSVAVISNTHENPELLKEVAE